MQFGIVICHKLEEVANPMSCTYIIPERESHRYSWWFCWHSYCARDFSLKCHRYATIFTLCNSVSASLQLQILLHSADTRWLWHADAARACYTSCSCGLAYTRSLDSSALYVVALSLSLFLLPSLSLSLSLFSLSDCCHFAGSSARLVFSIMLQKKAEEHVAVAIGVASANIPAALL